MKPVKLLSALLAAAMALSLTALAAPVFSDVPESAWYAEAVGFVRDAGLMSGTGEDAFAPNGTMTRAMLATVLYRKEGSPAVEGEIPFRDVAPGQWYSDAILWAGRNGIVGGYGDGLFGTNDNVTRQDMAAILWRYAGKPAAKAEAGFADVSSISSYAADAVNWARENGVLSGRDGNRFDPLGFAVRAELAAVLMNYVKMEEARAMQPEPEPQTEPEPQPAPEPAAEQSKTLVAYFSCTNNTKRIAEFVAEAADAELYAITPETPYTSEDLNYGNNASRATAEQNDGTARPAISGTVSDMEDYDVVFIGYPIWWGKAPMIIHTFMESYDFSGKTVIPFCTSGSSPIDNAVSSKLTTATVLAGHRFGGGDSEAAVSAWVAGLNLKWEQSAKNIRR